MTEPDPALSRAAAIPLLALAVVFVNENCSAESLALDPLTASVTVYGVSLDPTVSVSVDVSTTRFAVHAAGEIYVSMNTAKMIGDFDAIAKSVLPKKVQGGPCEFEIRSVSDLDVSVVGNTGDASVSADVAPSGCPLAAGQVAVEARFVRWRPASP